MRIATFLAVLLFSTTALASESAQSGYMVNTSTLNVSPLPDDEAFFPVYGDLDASPGEPIRGVKIDLNSDGTDDFIWVSDQLMCGTGGCVIVLVDGKSKAKIAEFLDFSFVIFDKTQNGYKEIATLDYSDADNAFLDIYVFRQDGYVFIKKEPISAVSIEKNFKVLK